MSDQQSQKYITPREREVIKLLSEGYTAIEIAEMLFISIHTVITHRKRLIEKFGARNTVQMVVLSNKLLTA